MKTELHPCYILHKRPYRETSLLLDVLSSEYGRVSLVARGARSKSKRNQQAYMQAFQKLQLSWSGKGEMGTLNKIEPESTAVQLSNSTLISGFYLNELIIRLLHQNEPHPELFDAYEHSLASLTMTTDEQAVLRCFEKALLQSLGYGLVLDHDVSNNQEIQSDKRYYYRPDNGPSECELENNSFIQVSGETLIAIERDDYSSQQCRQEAKKLMRSLINAMLGHKPLASRELYQSYLQQS